MQGHFAFDTDDPELEKVKSALLRIHDLPTQAGLAIREAIDHVIDGRHTARFAIRQLEKTEKTFIGTKVEQFLLKHLGLPKLPQGQLDTAVDSVPVDVKWTAGKSWMIPQEAVDQLCLVVTADDYISKFSLGLVRARRAYFAGKGKNRDRKFTLGKNHPAIHWLVPQGSLPENLLLHLPERIRASILAKPIGQQRVDEFFRLCVGKIVDGVVVETLAAQRDSSKRVRDARPTLKQEGIVICSNHPTYAEIPPRHGLRKLGPGEFVSLRRQA